MGHQFDDFPSCQPPFFIVDFPAIDIQQSQHVLALRLLVNTPRCSGLTLSYRSVLALYTALRQNRGSPQPLDSLVTVRQSISRGFENGYRQCG